MAKIHTLTYNGTKSSDLGVFVTGSGSFDAAEFDVDKYEIPGRNGDLILSNNRYKNIEITYPAFIPKAFMDKAQNVRNWLRSSRVYARLEDTYDMDHYRLGIPTGVQSFSPENRNDGANFEMTFDCKPQRFLKVGETPETVDADVQTESGEIVTFETVAESPITSASVSLSPIQSLNGYDSPWPAGGGTNKWDEQWEVGGISNQDGTEYNNSSTFRSKNYTPVIPNTTYYFRCGTADIIGLRYYDANKSFIFAPALNANRAFTTPADAAYLRFVDTSRNTYNNDISINYPSSVTTYSPYSNICPISGHTGAELNIAKHNIWDEEWTNGSINVDTGVAGAGNNVISNDYIGVTPNTAYYATQRIRVFFYDANKAFLSFVDIDHTSFTTPSECRYILFTAFLAYGTTYNNDISINYPATDTEYHAYDGDTYSVTFSDQGTVYGGTYDFVTGKLKVTKASVDLGTLSWVAGTDATGQYFRAAAPNNIKTPTQADGHLARAICSRYPITTSENVYNYSLAVGWSSPVPIFVRDTTFATAAAFKTGMSGVQLVYELATPLEYTLSAQQLTTLQGQNVVWGAGPITLTYAEPYNVENPTLFDARPLFTVTNPAEDDVIMVNGQAITFVDGYTGTAFIDCETMNAYSGAANLNSIIQATDFPVLVPGTNIVTWTGAGGCTMTPRWWEL